jgi:hyperosmotically inducible periplasmic protein
MKLGGEMKKATFKGRARGLSCPDGHMACRPGPVGGGSSPAQGGPVMASTHPGSPGVWWLAAGALAALCVGCEEKRTITQAPDGTVTTTTVISPSPQASEAMRQINETMAHAASAVESSTAASQLLTKTGDAIEDGVITTKIKAALLTDPDVKSLHIDVLTHNGLVTLSGTVDKAASVERAVRIARDTQGVKSVDNQLVVKSSA